MSDPLAYDPEDAYYGPLGALAKRHRSQISLNLSAFYAMLLPGIGSLIGRRAMIAVSRDKHFPNLFTAVVGNTGCGKGVCWCIVEDVLTQIDPSCSARLHRDVASAPGLICLVRDASERLKQGRVVTVPGVADKRCLVVFEEMDNLFTAMGRKGSTLDKLLNMAYDGRPLENNPREGEKATNAHIGTVCHITPEAFRHAVSKASNGLGCSNGFFNRFITAKAVKERSLPRGGTLPDVSDLIGQIRSALETLGPPSASVPSAITWHVSTHAEWDAFAETLDGEHPFLDGLGGLAARLKPNVMRVAMIFAVIDGVREIMPEHLKAAKAFCLDCVASSRDLFRTAARNEAVSNLRQRLLTELDHDPKTLTDWHRCLNKSGYTAASLRQVLAELTTEGAAQESVITTKHGNTLPAWSLPTDDLPSSRAATNHRPDAAALRMQRGAAVVITQDTHVSRMDGTSEYLPESQTAHLACIPTEATRDERRTIHALTARHPDRLCVFVGGEPAFVDRSALQNAAPAQRRCPVSQMRSYGKTQVTRWR